MSGTSNHTINGGGEQWWDGEGTNGGKTKPKFFYAHSLDDSTITGLNIKNTPVQAFSVQSNNLKLDKITIDNSDGDSNGGHNTDAFDVSESDGITISNAVVKNQDDCLAINSGSVSSSTSNRVLWISTNAIQEHRFHWRHLLRRPRPVYRLSRWTRRQRRQECYHHIFHSPKLREWYPHQDQLRNHWLRCWCDFLQHQALYDHRLWYCF